MLLLINGGKCHQCLVFMMPALVSLLARLSIIPVHAILVTRSSYVRLSAHRILGSVRVVKTLMGDGARIAIIFSRKQSKEQKKKKRKGHRLH